MGSIYNTPIHKNVLIVEVKTVVYHSSYLPFVDANIDDNSRDIAVLSLTKPLQFSGESLFTFICSHVTFWVPIGHRFNIY